MIRRQCLECQVAVVAQRQLRSRHARNHLESVNGSWFELPVAFAVAGSTLDRAHRVVLYLGPVAERVIRLQHLVQSSVSEIDALENQ